MRFSMALLGLLLLGLAGCDQQDKMPPSTAKAPDAVLQPADQTMAPDAPAVAEPSPEAAPESARAPLKPAAPAAVKPAPAEQKPPAAVPVAPRSEPARDKAPLDLSLPEDLLLAPLAGEELPLAPLLPPLFEAKAKPESPFQLHGKLISNERVDDYWESLEGAELQFEFKQ
jgi:hypothetical protein